MSKRSEAREVAFKTIYSKFFNIDEENLQDNLPSSNELTTKIVTGVIPRIEHSTGIKMGYTPFIQEKLARFVVEVTTEYNRVYESAGRYPDVAITMFSQAFSEALFDNKDTVTVSHVRSAIANSKAVV